MASLRIPKPGSEYGPCKDKCAHDDCAQNRDDSRERCSICGQEIGYDVDFYMDRDPETKTRDYKHAACAFVKARSK